MDKYVMNSKSTRRWKRRRALVDPPDQIGSRELAIKALEHGHSLQDVSQSCPLSARQIRYHAGKVSAEERRTRDYERFGDWPTQHRPDLKLPAAVQRAALELAFHHPDDKLNDVFARCQAHDVQISRTSLFRMLQQAQLVTADERRAAAQAMAEASANPTVWLNLSHDMTVVDGTRGADFLLLAVHEATGYIWGDIMIGFEAEQLCKFILNQVQPSMQVQGHATFTVKTRLVETIAAGTCEEHFDPLSFMPGLSALAVSLATDGITLRCESEPAGFDAVHDCLRAVSRQMQVSKTRRGYLQQACYRTYSEVSVDLAQCIAAWNNTPCAQQPCLGLSPADAFKRGSIAVSPSDLASKPAVVE
jgi:hypothetical protein